MFLEQIDRDKHVQHLLQSMNQAFALVTTAQALKVIDTRPAIVRQLAQQTMNCALFIRDYADQQKFGEVACATMTNITC